MRLQGVYAKAARRRESRLSNSPVEEWPINIADEAAGIKANREDKGCTRDLEVGEQSGGASEACSDWQRTC